MKIATLAKGKDKTVAIINVKEIVYGTDLCEVGINPVGRPAVCVERDLLLCSTLCNGQAWVKAKPCDAKD